MPMSFAEQREITWKKDEVERSKNKAVGFCMATGFHVLRSFSLLCFSFLAIFLEFVLISQYSCRSGFRFLICFSTSVSSTTVGERWPSFHNQYTHNVRSARFYIPWLRERKKARRERRSIAQQWLLSVYYGVRSCCFFSVPFVYAWLHRSRWERDTITFSQLCCYPLHQSSFWPYSFFMPSPSTM